MNLIQGCSVRFLQCLSLLMLYGCPAPAPRPGGPDSTAPEFVQVVVRLEAPTLPNPRAEFDITYRDIVRSQIGSDLTLRLIAFVGDPESGISNIAIESNLSWRCSFGPNSPLIGVFQSVPLVFQQFSQPSSPVTPLQINVVSDPVSQTGCARIAGQGPVGIRGHVRVAATNSAGMQVKSRTFIFEYDNAIGPATGTSTSTGRMDKGTETLYMAECRARGVPIPPDWHANTTAWVLHGNLRNGQNLLATGTDAYVWTFADPAVRGACIVLPRGSGGSRGGLAGVICQSATTGHACFWDSRKRNDSNPQSQMPAINWLNEGLTISELKDGTNLNDPDSGTCTDCHRGNNVFLISPDDPAWKKVIKTAALGSTFTTRVDASTDNQGGAPRYIPITGLGGQQRAGWANTFQAGGCGKTCHEMPANGGSMGMGPFNTPQPMPPQCAPTPEQNTCYR
jgi:hypothetical protein